MDKNKINYFLLGDECYKNGNLEGAIENFKKQLEKEPKNVFLINLIGYLYGKIEKYEYLDIQIEYFERALKIEPNYTSSIRNAAFAYSRAGMHQKAIDYFSKLLNLEHIPDDYFAYACKKIQMGDFDEGWKHYEYRFSKVFGRTEYPEINKPRWQGEPIPDKTLLVQYEQGFGDSIQFLRYLEQVKPFVGKIIFRVQKELTELFKINVTDVELVDDTTPIEDINFDFHIPLLSILNVLGAKIDNIPMSEGYIEADKEKVEKYRKEFFDNDCFKIGISWHGMALGNKLRNIPLRYFFSLAALKNVKIYSIQQFISSNEKEQILKNVEIIDIGKTFKDFSDTAAAIQNLDLFITSDNSVLNLAGAMAKRTFLLLPKDAEWRWFFDEDKTPWYDSVKIFKKEKETLNWQPSMQRVLDLLSEELGI